MNSMSTTRRRGWRRGECGFSLLEVMLSISLALSLAVAVAPLWISLQQKGIGEADRAVQLLQGRVAAARFERDLRLCTAQGCTFATSGALLEADSSHLVFVTRGNAENAPILVEWEITHGSLMRRRGVCPANLPLSISNALFVDHKTMLERVQAGSKFTYWTESANVQPETAADLAAVDRVVLSVQSKGVSSAELVQMSITGWVGR